MALVDYIGIFFTCGNTFGHITVLFCSSALHQGNVLMITCRPLMSLCRTCVGSNLYKQQNIQEYNDKNWS
jgi:hypothetical protein